MNLDGAGDRARLTAEQKKKNHIASEQKRREAIRKGFRELTEVVPDCEGLEKSESQVLQKTVAFLREQLAKKEELRKRALAEGLTEEQFDEFYNKKGNSTGATEPERKGKESEQSGPVGYS